MSALPSVDLALPISGMHCAACVARVEKTLAGVPGVRKAEVLLTENRAQLQLEPGWSAGAECRLNRAEQCWLDPERRLTDKEFAIDYRRGDWKDEICLRFGNWLNARLQTDKPHFGGPEALAWQAALGSELKMLREELDDE